MKITRLLILLTLSLTFFTSQLAAQSIDSSKSKIQSINRDIQRMYIGKDVNGLLGIYADSFTYMPEYKPAMSTKESLGEFYALFFKLYDLGYEKRIYKVEDFLWPYVLETGTFTLNYSFLQTKKLYSGNYMVMWKYGTDGKLRIIAETFGSGIWIEAKNVPYSSVTVTDPYILKKDQLSKGLKPEIAAFDKALVKSIEDGNGKARAEGFTKDGIYMPHFSSILEGMDSLMPYMLKTYTPEAKLYVKNTYREIFQIENYVFLIGHFKGGWGDKTTGGKFEGNMFNLMRREPDGKLYMYRQIANNDR